LNKSKQSARCPGRKRKPGGLSMSVNFSPEMILSGKGNQYFLFCGQGDDNDGLFHFYKGAVK
jgi:hypothetical protein